MAMANHMESPEALAEQRKECMVNKHNIIVTISCCIIELLLLSLLHSNNKEQRKGMRGHASGRGSRSYYAPIRSRHRLLETPASAKKHSSREEGL